MYEEQDELQPQAQADDQASPEEETAEEQDPLEGREDLQKALLTIYQKCCAEDRYPRLMEVKDVKQAENYWAGRQYDYWSRGDQTWKPITTATGGATQGSEDDTPRFMFVTNIYQSRGLMTIGAGSGATLRFRFFPEDPNSDSDLETAEGRTKLAKLIQRWNPPQKLLQEEYYHAWTGGFIVLWTRYVADGARYGIDSVHMLSQGTQELESTISCPQCGWSAPAEQAEPPVPCPQCGQTLTQENVQEEEPIPVPEDGQDEEVAKGREIISAYGALNCKRPQHTNQQSQWHYFAIEEEIHYSTLRAAFEAKADLIQPGGSFGADDMFERNARLAIAENSKSPANNSGSLANLVTFARIWLRPSAFWMADKTEREELLELFPRGVRVEFAGPTYCKAEAQSMDDCIATTHAMPGRGQHRNGIGTSMISVQDRFNTFTNIETETYEYGIPVTYRASDTFSGEADEEQRAAPGLEVEVALQPGQDLRQKIMQVRADSVSPDMAKHALDLMGPVADELTGTYPALTGAAEHQPETLGQQSMQRDAAMGRQGVFYVNLKQMNADILTLACRDLEAHSDGELTIPVFGASGDFESETVDITALEGEAEAYPEGDENFPELWNQQRATMMQIMDSPWGAELMKEPDNAELAAKLTGIPELKIPRRDAERKQLKEIAEMTAIPAGDQLLAGIAPLVDVDQEADDHGTEAAMCKSWLNSEAGQKLKRKNPLGWQAVKEHMLKHLSFIPKPAPPEKPLSETLSAAFKDMPPEAQAQVLAKWGIQVTPQDFLDGLRLKQAEKPPRAAMPPPPGKELPPAAGA